MSKNIVVIEGDIFRLQGIATYLSNVLQYSVRHASDSRTGWFLVTESPPEIVLINIGLTLHNSNNNQSEPKEPPGIALAREIKQLFPNMGLVLMGTDIHLFKSHIVLLSHRYGDSIQLLDTTDSMETLTEALDRLSRRTDPLPISLNEEERYRLANHVWALLGDAERPWIEQTLTRMDQLSTREWQLITLLGQSLSSQGIADKLELTRSSVDNAVSRIYAKLGLAAMRTEAPDLRAMVILIKANTLYTLRRSSD
ncbi:MAG: response regulator transcription factor [Anaerolineales bacterium]|nr:response regulator transcription factor [Anaerolineales bacterium]